MKTKNSKVENNKQAIKPQHVPERTCIACRKVSVKRDLIRLVCSSGLVELDLKGKKTGRGVYICPNRQCWEIGLKGNRIEFGLRTKITVENRQSLLEYSSHLA
jgi:uncharacterized protein